MFLWVYILQLICPLIVSTHPLHPLGRTSTAHIWIFESHASWLFWQLAIAEDGGTDNSSAPQTGAKELIIFWMSISWGNPQMRSCGCISLFMHYLSDALGTKEDKKKKISPNYSYWTCGLLKLCSTQEAKLGLRDFFQTCFKTAPLEAILAEVSAKNLLSLCLRSSPVWRSFPGGVPVFFPSY